MSSRDVVVLLIGQTVAGGSGAPVGLRKRTRGAPRVPSFFLLLTLKLPDMRFYVPIVIPLFVLEDLLESASIAIGVLGFLFPSAKRKIQHSAKGCKGLSRWDEEFDIMAVSEVMSELVRKLRSYGRFTLLEVSDGSQGVSITLRLI